MIYKFKSKATGDLIMLGPNGDQMLQLLGREPAPKGIIEVADMSAAIDALQRAVQAEDARLAAAEAEAEVEKGSAAHSGIIVASTAVADGRDAQAGPGTEGSRRLGRLKPLAESSAAAAPCRP